MYTILFSYSLANKLNEPNTKIIHQQQPKNKPARKIDEKKFFVQNNKKSYDFLFV